MILETERLIVREMTKEDFPALTDMLYDERVMYAYAHTFSEDEAQACLYNQLRRYKEDGFGLWAVILKETGKIIGQCGITKQRIPEKEVLEVGYLFSADYWHKGFATEAAIACKNYAFENLGANEVYSIIRDNNLPSANVAKRNGMTPRGAIVKHYYGIDMPHTVWSVTREEYERFRAR